MMQEYLRARGLSAPDPRIDASTRASIERAVDVDAAALAVLRDQELARDWTVLERPHPTPCRKGRQNLVDQIVQRARRRPE
jgi:hypothetical protein